MIKKNILYFSLALCSILPKTLLSAQEIFTQGSFRCEIMKDSVSVRISAVTADSSLLLTRPRTEVHIPASVTRDGKTYRVKAIREGAFDANTDICKIVIEDGIEQIDAHAFASCMGLESISIPASVKSIGQGIFYNCNNLREIEVHKKNKNFDSRDNCNAIIDSRYDELVAGCNTTVIPKTVLDIEDEAFAACNQLKKLIIPEGVEAIREAFPLCVNLESVFIPVSIKEVSPKAFHGCNALKEIIVNPKNKNLDSRQNCNAIIDTEDSTLILGCKKTIIPSGVEKIGPYAFYDCAQLTNIIIPEGVTKIGDYAFGGCTALKSVSLPQSLTTFADNCHFSGCISLENITIPKNVKKVEFNSFLGCTSLQSIIVEEGNNVYDSRDNCNAIIETATGKLLSGCSATIIPEGVTKIADYAFWDASLNEIHIPKSLTKIDSMAFMAISDCVSISVDEGNPVYYSPNNCNAIVERATGKLIKGCRKTIVPTGVKKIGAHAFYESPRIMLLPEGIEEIAESAFRRNKTLGIITMPSSLRKIGQYAFAGCMSLQAVILHSAIEEIPWGLCSGCTYLQEFNIPFGVKKIGKEAFRGCTKLKSIVLPSTITEIGKDAFLGAPCEEEINKMF